MVHITRLAGIARYLATFLLHFAHGSLVMAGVIVIAGVGYRLSSHGLEGLHPKSLKTTTADVAVAPAAPDADFFGHAAWTVEEGLSPEWARVSRYISRRYKISSLTADPLIVAAINEGRSAGLDPLLILAVTSVESRFNPFAESVVGAQGLMQIIPRFHVEKISSEKGKIALFDPAENIRVGTKILKEYLRWSGSLELALQQYNGASNDPSMAYANKVFAEMERLRQAKSGVTRAVAVSDSPASVVPVSQRSSIEEAS